MKIALKYASAALAFSLVAGSLTAGPGCATETASAEKSACTASATATEIVNVSNESKATCSAEAKAACAAGTKEVANKGGDCATACSAAAAQNIVNVANDADASPYYKVGSKVDDFTLLHSQSGDSKSLSALAGEKATLVIFWNQNCPYVEGKNGASQAIQEFAAKYADQGVSVVAVDAGINNSQDDIASYSKDLSIPLLVNSDSTIAAKFDAKYTPETFLLDGDMRVQYAGAFWTGSGEEVRMHAENAVQDLLAGRTVAVPEARGVGCSLKYADGAKPKKAKEARPTT